MKKKITLSIMTILMVLFLLSCGARQVQDTWSPYIGCSVSELEAHWGPSWSTNYYRSKYGSLKQVWYHKNVLFGGVFSGYSTHDFNMNILIGIRDGKIVSISYH